MFVQYAAIGSAGIPSLGSVALPHAVETFTRALVQVSQNASRDVALISKTAVGPRVPVVSHGSGQ